ncbi:hypothetical protein EYF80_033822 [Liparis tanakae]|uniref:Uncharacterized protein n=1 Tax=Liparis tanakae TaxID=230148 RepID=A0A4Z2GQZ2_9TELE|nr:hypothetical protein EYF80_033822 [Liparis tanakae]
MEVISALSRISHHSIAQIKGIRVTPSPRGLDGSLLVTLQKRLSTTSRPEDGSDSFQYMPRRKSKSCLIKKRAQPSLPGIWVEGDQGRRGSGSKEIRAEGDLGRKGSEPKGIWIEGDQGRRGLGHRLKYDFMPGNRSRVPGHETLTATPAFCCPINGAGSRFLDARIRFKDGRKCKSDVMIHG